MIACPFSQRMRHQRAAALSIVHDAAAAAVLSIGGQLTGATFLSAAFGSLIAAAAVLELLPAEPGSVPRASA